MMGVGGGGQQIIACLQDVGLGIDIIIGDKVIAVDGNSDSLGFTGLQVTSLFKAYQETADFST